MVSSKTAVQIKVFLSPVLSFARNECIVEYIFLSYGSKVEYSF